MSAGTPSRVVVVSGMGAVGPGFLGQRELWSALCEGKSACSDIRLFDVTEFKTRLAYTLQPEQEDGIYAIASELDTASRFTSLARTAASEAIRTAGLEDREDYLAVLGSAVGDCWEVESDFGALDRYVHYETRRSPREAITFGRGLSNDVFFLPPGRDVISITTGCTAGLDSLGVGWALIQDGAADRVVVVSVDAPITPMVIAAFDQIRALTDETHDLKRASIPFDRQRSGFCIGEGAAAFVLESEQSAKTRGVKPLARLRGYSTTSSAFHMTAIDADGTSIARSISDALRVARVDPVDVALVVPHATSTLQNDRAEFGALLTVFPQLITLPVLAGKAFFGHALGASNAIETVCAILSLGYKVCPAHPAYSARSIEFPDLNLSDRSAAIKGRIAVKNSSGFSGIHSAIVLEA